MYICNNNIESMYIKKKKIDKEINIINKALLIIDK